MTFKILAALDGSGTSESVLPYAQILLRRIDANLTLARVLSVRHRSSKPSIRRYLEGHAERLRAKGAYVDTAVLVGSVAEQLSRMASKGGYDLLALCTHGRSGLRRLFMGSVAEELCRRSDVPLLLAPSRDRRPAPTRFDTIVVPLDGSSRSERVLDPVERIAAAGEGAVTLVHVVVPGATSPEPVEQIGRSLAVCQGRLRKKGLKSDGATLSGPHVSSEILGHARSRGADLLALATHGRTGAARLRYGSVAEELLRQGEFPMLVVRTVAEGDAAPPPEDGASAPPAGDARGLLPDTRRKS